MFLILPSIVFTTGRKQTARILYLTMNADNHYTKGKMVLNIIIHTYYRCYNLQTPFCSLRIRYELSCLYSNSKTWSLLLL